MVDVSAKTNILFKTNTPLLTVAAFAAGAILFAFEGRLLPEGLWIGSTYGCFAASSQPLAFSLSVACSGDGCRNIPVTLTDPHPGDFECNALLTTVIMFPRP